MHKTLQSLSTEEPLCYQYDAAMNFFKSQLSVLKSVQWQCYQNSPGYFTERVIFFRKIQNVKFNSRPKYGFSPDDCINSMFFIYTIWLNVVHGICNFIAKFRQLVPCHYLKIEFCSDSIDDRLGIIFSFHILVQRIDNRRAMPFNHFSKRKKKIFSKY